MNIAIPHEPIDSPALAEFVALLEPINAIADQARIVWRLQDESGDATAIRPFEDERVMINMSVWESVESLWGSCTTAATSTSRRRREWFTPDGGRLHVPVVDSRRGDCRASKTRGQPDRPPTRPRPDPARVHVQDVVRSTGLGRTEPVFDDREPCAAS